MTALEREIREVVAPGGVDLAKSEPELRDVLMELEYVRPAFLGLCLLQERVARLIEEASQQGSEQEIARLSQAFAIEKDLGMRLTLRQTINLLQRKLEQQAHMADLLRTVELKLTLMEQSVTHIRSQRLSLTAPQELAREVREPLAQAATVSALEAQVPPTER
jgi:hypothetical protein